MIRLRKVTGGVSADGNLGRWDLEGHDGNSATVVFPIEQAEPILDELVSLITAASISRIPGFTHAPTGDVIHEEPELPEEARRDRGVLVPLGVFVTQTPEGHTALSLATSDGTWHVVLSPELAQKTGLLLTGSSQAAGQA
jgi:hypothetical protein